MDFKQFIFVFLILAGLTFAAIPTSVTVHGKLTNANNVSQASKTINMTFAIYNVTSGGTALYTKSNVNVATDYAGVYSYELSSLTLPFDANYYLGVTVANDSEMTPRINITSNGYAYRANVSDTLVSSGNYVVATMNATTFYGNLAWSYITNAPTYNNLSPADVQAMGNLTYYYNKTTSDGLYYNKTTSDGRYIQNGSSANLTTVYANSVNTTGDIISNGYLYGQPLLGMMGSGLIESTSFTGSKTSDINVSCTGLTCTYNGFKVRIMQGTAAQFATYCSIPNGTLIVPDNTFAAYYIDSSCNIVQTTYDVWFTTTMKTGGKWDFAYILTQQGSAEVVDSISLEQRRLMKMRQLNYYFWQSKVVSGFGFEAPATIAAGFNITAGKTVFGMDVVDVNKHIVRNATAHVEMVAPNGTGWQFNDNSYLNITHCNNGTGIVICTGNGWRRSFIFSIGFDDVTTGKTSELHALYPLLGTTYADAASCTDTTTNPLSYTLPDQYIGAATMLYAYCTQRTATNWNTANLIDLRSVKTGSATGGTDISGLVPYSGAVQNLNLGSYNLSAANLILTNTLLVDTTGVGTNGAINSNGNINDYYEINNYNKNNGTKASSDIVATSGIGSANSFFVDMGITSSGYTDTTWAVRDANASYLYAYNTSLFVGTASSGKPLIFFQGGNSWTNEAARFNASGLVVATNVTAQNFLGNLNASYVQNAPWASPGTATCSGVTVAQNVTTTTSGTTSQCITPPQGTVTSVIGGSGLTGGTITVSGTLAINDSYIIALLDNATIARNGTATCTGTDAAQNVTTSASGVTSQCIPVPQGTVTSVGTDGTMTGGTITGSGTLGVNTSIVALQNQSNTFAPNQTFSANLSVGAAEGCIYYGNGGYDCWNTTCVWRCLNATICSKLGTGC